MGPDDPQDTNPGGLDVDSVEDDAGQTHYVVLDDSGIAEVADEIGALTPAAQQRAAAEGFGGPVVAVPSADEADESAGAVDEGGGAV